MKLQRSSSSDEDPLERKKRQIELNQPAIALLESWLYDQSETDEEQRESLEALMRAFDEDRESDERLFDEFLK